VLVDVSYILSSEISLGTHDLENKFNFSVFSNDEEILEVDVGPHPLNKVILFSFPV
jgi:hypothetical protein